MPFGKKINFYPCNGNTPAKEQSSKGEFSRNAMRKFCNEEIAIHGQPDDGGFEASRSRYASSNFDQRLIIDTARTHLGASQ